MPEWLYEEGVGENRAILLEGDEIVEAAVEIAGDIQVGTILTGHVRDLVPHRRQAWVRAGGEDVLVRDAPPSLARGQSLRVEIVREEILEPGSHKSLVARVTELPERDGPTLADRIGPHRSVSATGPDLFEAAGWSELIEEAVSGNVSFEGGALRLSLTPAMTLFDVDGWLPPAELAGAGAAAAARAIRRHNITGSIGIDLPTLSSRTERQRAASIFDAHLPLPFERTAVNGFGFLQVVRKRERQSLPEVIQNTPIQAAALALLRRAERVPGLGARLIAASPAIVRFLDSRPALLDELRRRTGTEVRLQADATLTTWSFHVQSVQS